MEMTIAAVAALVAGIVIGYLIARGHYTLLLSDREKSSRRELAAQQESSEKQLAAQQESSQKQLEQLQASFDRTASMLRAQISEITEEMLARRQREFEESSRTALQTLTAPLNDRLRAMREAVEQNSERHTALGVRLETHIREMLEHSDTAARSAERLTQVLTAGGRHQGDMGEMILTELVESLHLVAGRHFDLQPVMDGEKETDGSERQRPDMIIHFDASRHLIIDSKVSFTAYHRYMEAGDEETRRRELQNHLASLESHVKELARKNYPRRTFKGCRPLEFVVMFVPFKAALRLALDRKPSLWREAMEQNVYIADEETLFAVLKIVSLTWQMNTRAENHEEICRQADELINRVNDFLTYFTGIRESLDSAAKTYDQALGKLTDGRQSVTVTCRNLKKLGARFNPKGRKTEHSLLSEPKNENLC